VNLQQYRNAVRINKHRLDDELEIQAQFLEDIGRQVALLDAKCAELKEELERTESRILIDLRNRAADKMAAQEISARVTTAPERIKASQLHAQAVHDLAEWKSLYEAWRGRGYALRTLADLHGQQYFSITSAGSETRAPAERIDSSARMAMRAATLLDDEIPKLLAKRRV
jgi:hypothetical protein